MTISNVRQSSIIKAATNEWNIKLAGMFNRKGFIDNLKHKLELA